MNSHASFRIFWLLIAVSVLIGWAPLAATFNLARSSDAYTHILIIVPISGMLVVLQWRNHSLRPVFGNGMGIVLLGFAIAIGVIGFRWAAFEKWTAGVGLSLAMLSMVTWWAGAFLFCFGQQALRACLFPLLYLVCVVPLPTFALNSVVLFLQKGTASITRVLCTLCKIPVAQHGTVLAVPGLTVEVAQECSSIRSSMLLIVLSGLLSYLLLRSYWGRTLTILAAIPIAVLKNALRVFALTMLGAYVDRGALNGRLHHQGGILFFALALVMTLGIVWVVARLERNGVHPHVFGKLHGL